MAVRLRLNTTYKYKGSRYGRVTVKSFDTAEHARAYARKVIASTRELEDIRSSRGRNYGSRVTSITVLPEEGDLTDGLVVDRWHVDLGWYRARVVAPAGRRVTFHKVED